MTSEHDEQDEAGQVHETVPSNRQRPEVESDRIELRVDQHEKAI